MDQSAGKLAFIDDIKELSSIPSITLDLLALLNDPGSNLDVIVEKIKIDQGMVSFILKTCNSSFYGARQQINSIRAAVNMVGYLTLKSILLSYFTRNLYNLSGKNYTVNYLWKHSISVAIVAKSLADKLNFNTEDAYLAGLLHDIGKLVLYIHNPSEYPQVLDAVEKEAKTFFNIERKIFEFTHIDTGYYLMQKWQFSSFLKKSLYFHHKYNTVKNLEPVYFLVPFANQVVHKEFESMDYNYIPFQNYFGLSVPALEDILTTSREAIEDYHSRI